MEQETGSSSSSPPPPPSSAVSATWTQAYGEAWYWDNRYSKDLSASASEAVGFDWYQKYSSLAPLIRLYVALHNRVLVVGCGNSAFSEGMLDDGYQDIVNIDISSVVIEAMKKKYCSRPELSCSFDAAIDKGTLDSILCGSNSMKNATMMLEEVQRYLMANYRVLKDKGVYILAIGRHSEKVVSSGCSEQSNWVLNKPVPLNEDGSSVEAALGRNPNVHYIYVCTKDDLSTEDKGAEEKSEF
ncbi:eEF1A lysine and N-terminal methyltransferase-like protein [Drosera capensis]